MLSLYDSVFYNNNSVNNLQNTKTGGLKDARNFTQRDIFYVFKGETTVLK